MKPHRKSRAPSAALFILAILVAGGSFWGWRYWRRRVMERSEAHAAACLKVLTVAEVDFRSNDRDANRINDFWTADVASLHSLLAPAGAADLSYQIQLIEKELAEADGSRPDARPYRGYLFQAMETDENGNAYREETLPPGMKTKNMSKFGFCAYPAVYGRTGRWTYLVNEGNTIFRVDTEGKPVLRFPPQAPDPSPPFGRPD